MRCLHRSAERVLAASALALALAVAAPASAETVFLVDSELDAVDAVPGDARCETAAGACTLRAAVQEANALQLVEPNETFAIELPAGRFALTIPGVDEDESATGDLDLCFAGALRGSGRDVTSIVGDGVDRVIEVVCAAGDLALSGIRVTGGGLATSGSGIHLRGPSPSLSLFDCEFDNNLGWGVRVQPLSGGLRIERCAVRLNGAGGIRASGRPLRGEISNSAIASNGGPGIQLIEAFDFSVARSVVANNQAGGVFAIDSGIGIVNSTIAANTAASGGGIALIGNFQGDFELVNSTIVQNTAELGGGIAFRVPEPSPRVYLANSILASNLALDGMDCASLNDLDPARPSPITSRGHNLIGIDAGCTLLPDQTDQIGTGSTALDPLLAPQAVVGGLPGTFAPLPGSPVIDAGSPEPPEGSLAACAAFDARGVSRPQDGDGDGSARCDIGAHEVAAAIHVAPREYDFGRIALGASAEQLVTVTNVGDAPLRLEDAALLAGADPGFARVDGEALPSLVDPADTLDLEVAFAPVAPGTAEATLAIASNDPDEPLIEVALTGIGATPDEPALALLALFDEWTASGQLVGNGPTARVADRRLLALRRWIESVADLLGQDRTKAACIQLEAVRRRSDGSFPPPDFVTGPAAPALEAEIAALLADLRCDLPPGRACGLGTELAIALPLLLWRRRRRPSSLH